VYDIREEKKTNLVWDVLNENNYGLLCMILDYLFEFSVGLSQK
jgi:hypothetical protein